MKEFIIDSITQVHKTTRVCAEDEAEATSRLRMGFGNTFDEREEDAEILGVTEENEGGCES